MLRSFCPGVSIPVDWDQTLTGPEAALISLCCSPFSGLISGERDWSRGEREAACFVLLVLAPYLCLLGIVAEGRCDWTGDAGGFFWISATSYKPAGT